MFALGLKGRNIKKSLILRREWSHSLTWLGIVMLLCKVNTAVFTFSRNAWRFLWFHVAGDIWLLLVNALGVEVPYVIYLPIQRPTPPHPNFIPTHTLCLEDLLFPLAWPTILVVLYQPRSLGTVSRGLLLTL